MKLTIIISLAIVSLNLTGCASMNRVLDEKFAAFKPTQEQIANSSPTNPATRADYLKSIFVPFSRPQWGTPVLPPFINTTINSYPPCK